MWSDGPVARNSGVPFGPVSSGRCGGGRGRVDAFGQMQHAIDADVAKCMICGRPVVTSRFAPQKFMAKIYETGMWTGILHHGSCRCNENTDDSASILIVLPQDFFKEARKDAGSQFFS